jgi:hypothetical protein
LPHPSDILGRGGPGYADQLAHQVELFDATKLCSRTI